MRNNRRELPGTCRERRPNGTFKEEREYGELPARIAALEAEQQRLHAAVGGAHFYNETADTIKSTLARIDTIERELLEAYARWEALDSIVK